MDTYQTCVILFSALIWVSSLEQGIKTKLKSSLELGQFFGGPAAHPHQNFCSVTPLPPWPSGWLLIRGWHLQYVWFQEHLFD